MKVYLDNNASTPTDPRVVEAMLVALQVHFGNPASNTHAWGWQAQEMVSIAREQVARALNVEAKNIIFTSGATEAINLAIQGLAHSATRRMVYSAIEHEATRDSMASLSERGVTTVEINTDNHGLLDQSALTKSLSTPTVLASFIAAHNEVGTIQALDQITELCHSKKTYVHWDMTQALGKLPLDLQKLDADLASCSAHKIYGPKGVGALYVSDRVQAEIQPLIVGGGHERGLRSGTLNVPGIVGFGKAAEIVSTELPLIEKHIRSMTDIFYHRLSDAVPDLLLHGHPTQRIPGNLNLYLPGVTSARLIGVLASSVALSATSACQSQQVGGSHVLKALGLSQIEQDGSFRVGIGRFNTLEEVTFAADQIIKTYRTLRT